MPLPSDPAAASRYVALRSVAPVHRLHEPPGWLVVDPQWVAAVLADPHARVRPPATPVPAFLAGHRGGAVFAALARMGDGPAHATARTAVERRLGVLDAAAFERATLRVIAASPFDPAAAGAIPASPSAQATPHTNPGLPSARATSRVIAASPFESATLRGADAAPCPAGLAPEDLEAALSALDRWIARLPGTAALAALCIAPSRWSALQSALAEWVSALSPWADAAGQARGVAAIDRLLDGLAEAGHDRCEDAAVALGLLMQPHEAVAGLVAGGLLRLARGPAAARAGIGAALAEAVLREDPPVHTTRRWMAEDRVVGGMPVRAGDLLCLVLAPPVALPFGAGAHACPGRDPAVRMAVAAWGHLVPRCPDAWWPEMAARVRWRPSVNGRLAVFGASW